MRELLRLGSVLLVSTMACAADEDVSERVVTFHDDIAPILNDHCSACHVEGGPAPFAIDDYDVVAQWAGAIVGSTRARTIPPFAVDNSGACHTFTDARWLADDELDTLARWVEDGTHEGDPPLVPLVPPSPRALGGAAVVDLTLPEYAPAPSEGDALEDYQCFRIDLGLVEDRYVVGFEVSPGNEAIVHHVLGFQVDPDVFDNEATMQALDAASPDRIGWECQGTAGADVIPTSVPVTWAPGAGAIRFPAGTGIALHPGDVLVVQVHYNLARGADVDATTVRLQYADAVERVATQSLTDPFLTSSLGDYPASLAPGLASVTYDWDETIADVANLSPDTQLEIWGFLPHMHQRGRKMHVRLERDGASECLAEVDRYDFDWQTAYFFERPIVASGRDHVLVTCDWDTRQDTQPVAPGFATSDEMCLLGLYVVPR